MKTFCLRTDIKSCTGALQVQIWEDGPHPLSEDPGGLHAQKAGGCHQKGWQHIQVLVQMLYIKCFNFICSKNVKINMCGQFLLRRLYFTTKELAQQSSINTNNYKRIGTVYDRSGNLAEN